jgi:phosphatidylglycerol:prolipoprotein diacylglycerol transferase
MACRYYKFNPWVFADAASPAVLLGQVFGRFGNFMNGDAYGLPTNLPWGIVFPSGTPAGNQFPGQPLHPTMLYELVLNLIFFLILHRLQTKNNRTGLIFSLYLIFYAVSRTIVSFFRADDLMIGVWRAPHLVSIALILFAWYFLRSKVYGDKDLAAKN